MPHYCSFSARLSYLFVDNFNKLASWWWCSLCFHDSSIFFLALGNKRLDSACRHVAGERRKMRPLRGIWIAGRLAQLASLLRYAHGPNDAANQRRWKAIIQSCAVSPSKYERYVKFCVHIYFALLMLFPIIHPCTQQWSAANARSLNLQINQRQVVTAAGSAVVTSSMKWSEKGCCWRVAHSIPPGQNGIE